MSAPHQCEWCRIDTVVLSALESGAQHQIGQLEQWVEKHGPESPVGLGHTRTAAALEALAEQMAECVRRRT